MKIRNWTRSLVGLCLCGSLAAPAAAVVTDDLESYTVGSSASDANPGRYTDVGGYPVGTISNGTATANVASSKVIRQENTDTSDLEFTRVNADAPLTGAFTLSFDFLVGAGSNNVYFRDTGSSSDALLIQLAEAGAGAPTQYFIQSRGQAGSIFYTPLVEYGHWIRLTAKFDMDAGNPSNSTVELSAVDLTTGASLGSGSDELLSAVSQLDQLQFESNTAGGGTLELDNFVVPEPASLGIVGLGATLVLARRRRRP